MSALWGDLRYALRQLRNSPGFTITAVLTLALGIGATTAIFTLVYDVLLKPLPYPHPGQLVMMQERIAELRNVYPALPVNAGHFMFWRQHSRSFEAMAVMEENSMPLGSGGHPLQVEVLRATPGIFSVLETTPQLGRAFVEQEGQPGHERVAVLMYDLWRRQFQSDPRILGKTITLNGFPYTVIGVMPQSFHLPHFQTIASFNRNRPEPVEALAPLAFSRAQLLAMGDFDYFGLARLRQGVSLTQANAEVDALQHTISANLSANEKATLSVVFTPFQQALVGNNRKPLLVLLAAVAGLLLVGCVNIANLLLVRAAGRRRHMALAAALGASRAAMVRIAMREMTVLACLGGASGILLAMAIVPVMWRYLPPALDFRGSLHLDWAGAGCALLLSFATMLLAGAVPAWTSARTESPEALRSESRLASESRSGKQPRRVLVAVEVAVSVALVLITGLIATSLSRLLHTDRGFEAEHIVTATVDLPNKSYSDHRSQFELYKRVLDRLAQLPGVERAGVASGLPLSENRWIDVMRISGDARPITQLPTEDFRWISPGYFEVIHLPLIAGRLLSASDEGKKYAVVSELTAQTLWPGKDPIGRQFTRAGTDEQTPFTVIGVVGNARTISLAMPDPMVVYMPYWYRSDDTAGLLVLTRQDPAIAADDIRRAVWSIDPAVAAPTVGTLSGVIADSMANRRYEMDLLLLFAISAALLAGLGIYGVVTYSVVQSRRDIGVRMALGAQRANIYRSVLRDGLTPVFAGAIAGIMIAFGFGRIVSSLLFQVSPYSPGITISAVCVLLAVGTAACLLPARRAASIDPMQALRAE